MDGAILSELIHNGNAEHAAALAEKTLLINNPSIDEKIEIVTQLVRARRILGEYATSLKVSIDFQDTIDDNSPPKLGMLLVETANTQRLMRDYNDSEETLCRAITIMGSHDECLQEKAQATWSLGVLYRVQGKYNESKAKLTDAKNECEKLGYPLGVAHCYRELGVVLRQTRQLDEATEQITKAMRLYVDEEDAMGIAHSHREIGTILRLQQKYTESYPLLSGALIQFAKIGAVLGAANTLTEIGALFQAQDDKEKSSKYYTFAKKLYDQLNDKAGVSMLKKIQLETEMQL